MDENALIQFIDGIFSLNTRRFGTVAEIMIKKLFGFTESDSISYDLYDSERNLRIEVKFSRVTRKCEERICEGNVVEQCMESAILENRALCVDETTEQRFDCNIEQIKRDQFDVLFYGLFYVDYIQIFCVDSRDVGNIQGYCNTQHYGNKGEGQFHINNNTLNYHLRNHLHTTISYAELFDLFT